MRIFILGDPHIQPAEMPVWQDNVEDINLHQPDVVLVLGDLTGSPNRGSALSLKESVTVLNQLNAPWHSIIGNHDLESKEFDSDEAAISEMLRQLKREKPWFKIDFELLTVIGLSNTRHRRNLVNKHEIVLEDEQLEWFCSELKKSEEKPVLVLCHAPPLGSGVLVMPELHVRVGNAYVNQNQFPGRIQQIIWENPNILFWFSGHNHLGQQYRDAIVNTMGVVYAHTGTAGIAQCRDGQRHSRILDVSSDGFVIRTFDHATRQLVPELDYEIKESLSNLVAARRRVEGRRYIPRNPKTMHPEIAP